MPGKNINQMDVTTTLSNTDKMYLGRSPFAPTDDHAIAWSNVQAEVNTSTQLGSLNQVTGLTGALSAKEATANKDASGGYAGLTLFKINFKNALNTFTSFLTNSNTAARTYTFQNRDGTIADNTDLAGKQDLNANLTGLAALTTILTGPIIQKSASTYSIPEAYNYTGTTFNNLTNSPVVGWGDTVIFTNSGTITTTLNGTGLGIGFEFFIKPTAGGTLVFTGAGGTTIIGLPSTYYTSTFAVPLICCRITAVGEFHTSVRYTTPIQQVFTDTTTSRTLSPSDVCAFIRFTNVNDVDVTIDSDANQPIPNGAFFDFLYLGGADHSLNITTSAAFDAAGGVILNDTSMAVGFGGKMRLSKYATNTWRLDYLYEEYAHTTTWSGIWSGSRSGDLLIVRENRLVTVTMPVVTATATTSSTITMGTSLPARLRPSSNTETRPLVVSNSSVVGAGGATVSGGGITIFATTAYGNFTGAGTGGFFGQNFTYTL